MMVPTITLPPVGLPAAYFSAGALKGIGSQTFAAFLLLDAGDLVTKTARLVGPIADPSLTPSRSEAPAANFAGLVAWAKQPRASQGGPVRRPSQTKRPGGRRPESQQESEPHHA